MKIRSGFVSNSSSSSFILNVNYDDLYNYDLNVENMNKIFKPELPASLKNAMLYAILDHTEKVSDSVINVYIDPDYYVSSDVSVILARNPYDYLNESIIKEVRTHV